MVANRMAGLMFRVGTSDVLYYYALSNNCKIDKLAIYNGTTRGLGLRS